MRVFRIEMDYKLLHTLENELGIALDWEFEKPVNQMLRAGVIGAFHKYVVGSLYSIPGPYSDEFASEFINYPFKGQLFYAFPSFDWIVNHADQIHDDAVISEYEVVPKFVSKYQVLFHYKYAKHISSVRMAELIHKPVLHTDIITMFVNRGTQYPSNLFQY